MVKSIDKQNSANVIQEEEDDESDSRPKTTTSGMSSEELTARKKAQETLIERSRLNLGGLLSCLD